MKVNKLGYLFKEGIRGIFLHGFMSVAAVVVTVACLMIVGTFSSLTYNLTLIVEDLNKTSEIMVYVDDTYSDAKARSVGTSINRIENVLESRFISREEALQNFIANQDNPESFVDVDADTLEHRYSVILVDNRLMDETKEELALVPGVTEIRAADELAKGFSAVQDVLYVVSTLIIVVLLIVSLLIISNTVKLAMYDRKDEIAIMKMVGATNGFIRLPFVVEGFVLGIVGAGIAFGLEWLLYDTLATKINTIIMDIDMEFIRLVPFTDLVGFMALVFGAAGLFVGVVGSWTSIRKFMDV